MYRVLFRRRVVALMVKSHINALTGAARMRSCQSYLRYFPGRGRNDLLFPTPQKLCVGQELGLIGFLPIFPFAV